MYVLLLECCDVVVDVVCGDVVVEAEDGVYFCFEQVVFLSGGAGGCVHLMDCDFLAGIGGNNATACHNPAAFRVVATGARNGWSSHGAGLRSSKARQSAR